MSELWTLKKVANYFAVTRRTIYRWMHDEDFPKPKFQFGCSSRWESKEVEEWRENRQRVWAGRAVQRN
jgi:excisionase family DNA binding protein